MLHEQSLLVCREVFFETNGVPRAVEIVDRTEETGTGGPARKAAREKADPQVLGSVGAPMAGEVIEVSAKPGLFSSVRHVLLCAAAAMPESMR